MKKVSSVGLFISNTQDFAFTPLKKMSIKRKVSVLKNLQAFDKYVHFNGRCGLKKVLTITKKKTLKCLQGITLFKDFETIFAFLFKLTHRPLF